MRQVAQDISMAFEISAFSVRHIYFMTRKNDEQ